MKNSHFITPRQLKDATLSGIGLESQSEPSWVWIALGVVVGFVLGVLV